MNRLKPKLRQAMAEIHAGPEAIAMGVDRLSKGLLVAFPTETVYGLGADALRADAVERVFALKGRPSTNPLIVHVSGIDMARRVVANWTIEAQRIAEHLWPGPVTIVLPKATNIPDIVCAGGPTVAVRCPEHPVALALIESFGKPIVGPSANPSGRISPTTPEHVFDSMRDADLLILDGGHCRAGIESTVVDLSTDVPTILRLGVVGAHTIADIIRKPVACATQEHAEGTSKSPGLVGPHYQPMTPTKLVPIDALSEANDTVVILAWSVQSHPHRGLLIAMPTNLDQYASKLYGALHDADKTPSTGIWVEMPPIGDDSEHDRSVRAAIMERLQRATHA